MLELKEKKRNPKFDEQLVLSNAYMKKQIDGNELCKLVSKRKKVPHKALYMWKYNKMRQKDIFSEPLVHGMCTDLHNTYKAEWFNMTREKNTYYLLAEEPEPLRTLHHKGSIGKVMFLTAVAKPRFGEGGVVTFDGKIGTWAFVQETPAKKKSKHRERGTLELKSMTVTRDVMRQYLCEKVLPAIHDLWPDEDDRKTIYIQQDNAKPHVLPDDEGFLQAVAQTGLDIRLLQQPPNSPDMNILDLCFLRSIQSLTDCRAPQNIRELIEAVEQEYQNYEVNKLNGVILC